MLTIPLRAAFDSVNASARALTSIAHTVAAGARSASVSAIAPAPHPRSSSVPTRRGWRRFAQQQRGSRVEVSVAEHAAIGCHRERHVGESDVDHRHIGCDLRSLIEVMRHQGLACHLMAYSIRTYGDPVLKSKAAPITDVDGKLVRLVDDMFTTLYESELGIALAAPQIGVQKQIFVWDLDGEQQVIFNPEIVESDGEWVYDEGCLSIPGLYVEMVRPKTVLMRGIDIQGNVVEREADELESRMYQHELDHLHGVLMFDRMTPEQRKEALGEYRRLQRESEQGVVAEAPRRRRLRLK